MDRLLSSESELQRLVNWKSCELGSKNKKDIVCTAHERCRQKFS